MSRLTRAGIIGTALLLAAASAAGAQTKKDAADLGEKERTLQQTQKRLKEERAKAADARKREASLLTELEAIDKRLTDKRRQVAALDARVRRAQRSATSSATSRDSRSSGRDRKTGSASDSGPCTACRRKAARSPSCSRATIPWPSPSACAT